MMDESARISDVGRSDDGSVEDQRRRLELQLIKIRSEASAARLEARAAELELMIRELSAGESNVRPSLPSTGTTASGTPINPPHIPISVPRFEDWEAVRSVSGAAGATIESPLESTVEKSSEPIHRIDGVENALHAPHFSTVTEDEPEQNDVVSADTPSVDQFVAPKVAADVATGEASRVGTLDAGDVSVDADLAADGNAQKRRKPAGFFVSAIVHVGIILLMAAIGLQTQRPKDQIALAASTTQANEVSMETFSIESNEPEPETSEPTPSEMEYDLSPVGEIAAAEFAPESPPAPPSPAAAAMTSSEMTSAAAMSLESDSEAKIQFCGVEGGGNHFVYLVDSSGSMGDGFESARRELLSSIEALKPEQRFYVVFFDAESDFMRLASPDRDEPRSVYATPQNKAALKRWAMRIAMDRGRAPYDPLEFALELKPDVIFLLSDGEFPQGIEDLLREENRVENLFGDSYPISIVHTISYHSKEGESRMRRIAEQNNGQYRYIPKP